jgi:hypothetical protein
VKYEIKVKELKEENFNLKDKVASLEAEVKANQNRLELNKLTNERDRLILEFNEWQAKYNKLQRELKEQKEENEELRDQLRKAKTIADELEINNNTHNIKMKEIEKQVYENSKKDTKLLNIEDMISKVNATLTAHKEEENIKVEKNNEELQNNKKLLKKLGYMLKRLTQGLFNDRLRNRHVQDLFRFGNIALDNKGKLYKSLLKIIAAVHYTNKNSKIVKHTFNKWKSFIEPKLSHQEPIVKLSSRPVMNHPIPNKEAEDKLDKSFEEFEFDLTPYELSNEELLKEYRMEIEALKRALNNDTFKDTAPILYFRIINGIAKYFFNIYLIILKDAKLKHK